MRIDEKNGSQSMRTNLEFTVTTSLIQKNILDFFISYVSEINYPVINNYIKCIKYIFPSKLLLNQYIKLVMCSKNEGVYVCKHFGYIASLAL